SGQEPQNMHMKEVQMQTSALSKIQLITFSHLIKVPQNKKIKTIYSTSKKAKCNSSKLLKS
ncbi:16251_t:CDS:1, partial [Gigaspora margarita]